MTPAIYDSACLSYIGRLHRTHGALTGEASNAKGGRDSGKLEFLGLGYIIACNMAWRHGSTASEREDEV